eukprot:g4368.t1
MQNKNLNSIELGHKDIMKSSLNLNRSKDSSDVSPMLAAASYFFSSLALVLSNKILLTSLKFPSFRLLAVGQFAFSLVLLHVLRELGLISFFKNGDASLHRGRFFVFDAAAQVFPLPFLFLGNVVCGLGATGRVNIAMFSALRRVSSLFALVAEAVILNVHYPRPVVISVFVMVFGGLVAAYKDLSFDFYGYLYILVNNFFTAAYGIVIKIKTGSLKKAKSNSFPQLGKFGLLYYNSLCSAPLMIALLVLLDGSDLLEKVSVWPGWGTFSGVFSLFLSLILGVVLNYSIFLCTQVTSATTTSVVGSLKNILAAYASILGVGGDYEFETWNFIGLNVSMIASIAYSHFQLKSRKGNNTKTKDGKKYSSVSSVTKSAPVAAAHATVS